MRRHLPLLITSIWRHCGCSLQRCIGCGGPAGGQPCRACEIECRAGTARTWHASRTEVLRPVRAVYYFGLYTAVPAGTVTGLANALRRFKYHGDRAAGHSLRRLVARNAAAISDGFDAVVAVPLHPARLRARGFNQSAWLARGASSGLRLALAPDALVRTRHGPPQASLGGRERRSRNPDMFRIGSASVEGMRLLLVDDVLTTGTTVRSAAAELLAGGAHDVTALVLLVAGGKLGTAATLADHDSRRARARERP